MVSPLLFAALVYLMAGKADIGGLAAGYETWFLAGGLVSALASMPMRQRFRRAVEQPRGTPRDAAYWQRVATAMMPGLAVAELPFFIGFAAYIVGGYTRTAAILLLLSMVLQSRFKPPSPKRFT